MRWPLVVAWSCAALAAAAAAGAVALRVLDEAPSRSSAGALAAAAFSVPALAAGVAIARRRPGNPVGAIVAGLGLLPALDEAFSAWADAATHGHVGGAGWAALLFGADWIPVFALLSLLLMLFPDGRPVGPRWRLAVAVALLAPWAALLASAVRDERFDAPYQDVARPLPTAPAAVSGVLTVVALAGLLASVALGVAAIIVRARRARGVERVQVKWLAAASILLPVALVAGILEGLVREGTGPITFVTFLAAYLALVGAVAVAMLRHGLYDVDRVISQTIAWLIISVLLAGGAVAIALVVAVPLGGGSTVAAAVAAVAAALAFDPLRRRLQRVVDRRFDRDRARALGSVEAFAARLRDGAAAPEDIEPVLRDALGDPGLRLLVWLPEHGVHADLGGAACVPSPGEGQAVTAIGRGVAPLGVVVHAQRLLERRRRLDDVLRAAALPVEVARLRCELRRRLEEVEESRARIVLAGDDERRRLQRDLHDGAQQRLVALGMALRRVQRRPGADREVVRALDGAVDRGRGRRRGAARDRARPAAVAARRRARRGAGTTSRGGRRCPSGWRGRPRACRRRSRPPPTTWSARRWRTRSSTPGATRVDGPRRRGRTGASC